MRNTVFLGDYEISLEDFLAAAEYVLTNTDLEPSDPRILFVKYVRSMKEVDGYNLDRKRLEAKETIMELCQICNQEGEDRRTLHLQYFYDMSEISDKLVKEEVTIRFADGHEVKNVFWTIRTCKDCRGHFLDVVRRWTSGEFVTQTEDDPERNIPVRVDGRVVMMTTEEWQSHTASLDDEHDRVPHRLGR
jgi:hypothetical protein